MRLVCPECATAYDVPEAALTAGRRLRCSACAASWEWTAPGLPPEQPSQATAAPPPPAPPPAAPEPAPAAAEKTAPATPPPRIEAVAEERMAPPSAPTPERSGGTALAWVASLVVIAIAVAALYVWRDPVMHAWPPSVRLYTALGIA